MQGDFSFVIVLGLVAVFILLRLRSILGQRNDEDGPMDGPRSDNYLGNRYHRQQQDDADNAIGGPDNVIDLPGSNRQQPAPTPMDDLRIGDNAVDDVLDDMAAYDRNFRAVEFMEGARQAYEMIIDAYAGGDVRLLRGMLNKDVFESFNEAIEARIDAGHQLDHTLISLDNVALEAASFENGFAALTVRFTSQQIDALRDAHGAVIEGDETPAEVIDIWTFARDLGSSDPNWTLIATGSPDA